MTTPNDITLQDLQRAAKEATASEGVPGQAHRIIREIQRSQVIAEAKKNYLRTGKYLPKRFKRRLAEKYHFSQKQIEHIVYPEVEKHDCQMDMFDSET